MSGRRAGHLRARLAALAIGAVLALPIVATNAAAAGLFAPYQSYPVGSWPEAVAIGDVTGDGRADVAMTTSYYFDPANDFRLWIFAQATDGTLEPPVSYATASTYTHRAESVAIGDITGDGRADVVLGLGGLGIQVFPQDPSGALGTPTFTPTTDSDWIRLGQLDGDGRLDLAGAGWGSNTVSVLLNDGGGGLAAPTAYPAQHGGWDDLEVGDVTADGRDDLVVMSGQSYAVPNLSVLAQLPGGGFGPAAEYDVGTDVNTNGIGVGDVNGDGRNDVVVSYGGNSPSAFIGVFTQTAGGILAGPASRTSYDIPEPVDVADLDLDGRADIVTLHGGWNEAGVYRQLADGSLSSETLFPIPYATHYNPHGLAVGDVNGDGYPDIVLADYNHGLVVLRNRPTLPPAVPGAPSLDSAAGGNASVSLSWTRPVSDGGSAILGYNIYRGTGNVGGPLLATVGSVASYTDATAVNGTTYYYQVSAVNSVGEGLRSNTLAATPATIPGAPSLISAAGGDTSVALSWAAPTTDGGSPITGYVATATPGGATCSASGLGCTIGGLTNGTSYSLTVRATNLVGTGPASNALSATPTAPGQPPSAPQNVAISPNQPEGILVTWTAPSSSGTSTISGYRIYRGGASQSETYLASIGNVLSFTDTAVSNGGLYYYQVTAINTTGEGPRSAEKSGQRGTAPTAPRTLTASANGPGGVSLKWSAPASSGGSAVTGYRIYRATTAGGEVYLVSVGGTATSFADKGTTKGVRYYYWIAATNVLGVSPASNEANAIAK
jgi:fibronectin type 3 domain-containing protein